MKEISLLSYLHETFKFVNYFGYAVRVSLYEIENMYITCYKDGNISINEYYRKMMSDIHKRDAGNIGCGISEHPVDVRRKIKELDIIPDNEVYKYKQL